MRTGLHAIVPSFLESSEMLTTLELHLSKTVENLLFSFFFSSSSLPLDMEQAFGERKEMVSSDSRKGNGNGNTKQNISVGGPPVQNSWKQAAP